VTPDLLARALPFIAAALAQILVAIVRRLSGAFTSAHFERLESEEVLLEDEARFDPGNRPRRLAKDVLPSGYRAAAIAEVNSKNADGANALTGSITVLAAVLGSGLIASNVWYAGVTMFSVGLGLAVATWLWLRDPEKYEDKRWLGVSRTAVALAIANLALAAIAATVVP
jgi:hypothetical protein